MCKRLAVLLCACACLLGCQAAEPVKPLSPLEVQLLVQAAVKGLLMTKPATETELLALRAWVQAARVTTTEDLAQSLTTLSEHAPEGWQDLVAVGSGILLERVGLRSCQEVWKWNQAATSCWVVTVVCFTPSTNGTPA